MQIDKESLLLLRMGPEGRKNVRYRSHKSSINVSPTTLHGRCQGRRNVKQAARCRQNLTPEEEQVLVASLCTAALDGYRISNDNIRELGVYIQEQRSSLAEAKRGTLQPFGKNWATDFVGRHGHLKDALCLEVEKLSK